MRVSTIGAALLLMAVSSATSVAQQQANGVAPRAGQRVVFITGSTDGLGRETARKFASEGAHVIVHGRSRERGDSLVREINQAGKGTARLYIADLASLAEVRTLAAAVLRDYQRLDVLINNAGIGSTTPPVRTVSADGHELRFAVNYLAGFLLTRTLLPLIEKSAPSRIIMVASSAQQPIDFNDVMITQNYSGSRAYGQSKLSQIMFAFDLAEELKGKNVLVNALHPSTYMPTTMVKLGGFTPRATIDDGVTAVTNLANTPDIGTGQYFSVLRVAQPNAQARDTVARNKLRLLTIELTKPPR